MNRGRKQPREGLDAAEIFSDADFDADDFVEEMDEKHDSRTPLRAGWRRLEELREDRLLQRQLEDYADFDDFERSV